jgi:site-specific recombinase XerD
MLTTLFPRAFHAHTSLPLLGSIADGFDDWLSRQGYTVKSRTHAIEMLRHIEKDLRPRGIEHVTHLTHSILHDSWKALIQRFPTEAGTVRALERFLSEHGLLDAYGDAEPLSEIDVQITAYVEDLREIHGYAPGTISAHARIARSFLTHFQKSGRRLQGLNSIDLEAYLKKAAKHLGRGGLQNEAGVLRSFLRFLAAQGKIQRGLDGQIDTPRLYRLEKLPRFLSWGVVRAFLHSIDRTTKIGLRDYTIFLLMATYGLRTSEIVALTLEDVQWRSNKIRIVQPKTWTPLELPLTNAVGAALLKYLKHVPPRPPHRQLFLRMMAPIGPLRANSVTSAFQAWSRRSGLNIPFKGAHCLRHSYAANLLNHGTSLKTIGDILGHQCARSTVMYLRLATEDLRDVTLPLPVESKPREVRA